MACLSVGNLGTPAPMDERQAAELAYEALVRAAVSSTTAASATDAALGATPTTTVGLCQPTSAVGWSKGRQRRFLLLARLLCSCVPRLRPPSLPAVRLWVTDLGLGLGVALLFTYLTLVPAFAGLQA